MRADVKVLGSTVQEISPVGEVKAVASGEYWTGGGAPGAARGVGVGAVGGCVQDVVSRQGRPLCSYWGEPL